MCISHISIRNRRILMMVIFEVKMEKPVIPGQIKIPMIIEAIFKSANLSFREITSVFLDKYEVFLRKWGRTDGGISVRMRAIRAIYNRAIDRNIVKSNFYPFRAYKIAKLKGKKGKKELLILCMFTESSICNLMICLFYFIAGITLYLVFIQGVWITQIWWNSMGECHWWDHLLYPF